MGAGGGDTEEADSARAREWRSKRNQERPSLRLGQEWVKASASAAAPDVPATAPGVLLGDLRSAPVVPRLDAPVARGLRSKATPVEAIRRSARSAGDDAAPILDRAVRLAADKNNPSATPASTSKNPTKGPTPDPIFAILQDLPDAHLLAVASDCCVAFTSSQGSPSEALSLIRAKELAQAALANTRARLDMEAKESTATQCPEGGPSQVPHSDVPAVGAQQSESRAASPSPPKATIRKRSKSVAPQGRRPATRLARAQGLVI